MTITRKTAHKLHNLLQELMGYVELGEVEKAKDTIRKIAEFLNLHTERKPRK